MILDQFVTGINGWLGNRDYPRDLVISWIRMAEERMNDELRIRDMIKLSLGDLLVDRVTLPEDWLEMDFVRVVDNDPLVYMARDDFYKGGTANKIGRFTYVGVNIVVGGIIPTSTTPTRVEIAYFGMVPPFVDASTWFVDRHPKLLTMATLTAATAYGVDDERAAGWEAYTKATIAELNIKYIRSKSSGSKLVAVRKGFG